MDRILYYIYYLKFKNRFIDDIYKRVVIRLVNVILPVYYRATLELADNQIDRAANLHTGESYIVSLTTFPVRINKVWITIESILRQKNKPDAVILWLCKGEFAGKSSLPKELLKQEKRGLQIRFCDDNIKPHKKYYYTLQQYPKANIITVDDDVIYPQNFVEKLKEYNVRYPGSICGTIVQRITYDESGLRPYREWTSVRENTIPSFSYLPIGAGGVLYPPNSLHPEVMNKNALQKLALTADDLWLKLMSVLQGTRVAGLSGEYSRFFIPLIIKNNKCLMNKNVSRGENNQVIRGLLDYYKLSYKMFDEEHNVLKQR